MSSLQPLQNSNEVEIFSTSLGNKIFARARLLCLAGVLLSPIIAGLLHPHPDYTGMLVFFILLFSFCLPCFLYILHNSSTKVELSNGKIAVWSVLIRRREILISEIKAVVRLPTYTGGMLSFTGGMWKIYPKDPERGTIAIPIALFRQADVEKIKAALKQTEFRDLV